MEERITNLALALCTRISLVSGVIDDDMNSANAHAILAQITCYLNGGENCTSIGTVHSILLVEYVDQHVD
jgi:hypothetical protein